MTPRTFAPSALMAALFAASLALPVQAQAQEPLRQISVSGEGSVEVEPDMATITLGVTQQAKEAGAAMQATSDAVSQVLARLETAGIAQRDLQTRQLTLSTVWSQPRGEDQERQITGFVASNTVLVRVRDMDALGGILDAVISEGANNFSGLRFGVQNPDPLQDEARKRAVADAMARARLLAEAAGVTLGPVLTINDQGGSQPMPMAEMSTMRLASAKVPVAAGEISVSASVSMVFAIADDN